MFDESRFEKETICIYIDQYSLVIDASLTAVWYWAGIVAGGPMEYMYEVGRYACWKTNNGEISLFVNVIKTYAID